MFVIVAPPRCSSTALARDFWEHPSVGASLHEPFDLIYHRNDGVDDVLAAFARPIALHDSGTSLIIKEMTFQVGDDFHLLVELTRKPIIFMVRDPRLSTASRMRKLKEGDQDPVFPQRESGWDDLRRQIRACKNDGVPYLIVDSTTFRNHSEIVIPNLFARLGLTFTPDMLAWSGRADLHLGNLDAEQNHWYSRVLASTGVEPAIATPQAIEDFPAELQSHLRECLEAYRGLLQDEHLISS